MLVFEKTTNLMPKKSAAAKFGLIIVYTWKERKDKLSKKKTNNPEG